MADTTIPKAMESLAISKTKELKGTEKRDTLIEIEKVRYSEDARRGKRPEQDG